MTRKELIVAVRRIIDAEGTEEEINSLIDQVSQALPHPRWTDLIFQAAGPVTAEQVVDEALDYRATRL